LGGLLLRRGKGREGRGGEGKGGRGGEEREGEGSKERGGKGRGGEGKFTPMVPPPPPNPGYATDQNSTPISLTCKMLYNRSLPG